MPWLSVQCHGTAQYFSHPHTTSDSYWHLIILLHQSKTDTYKEQNQAKEMNVSSDYQLSAQLLQKMHCGSQTHCQKGTKWYLWSKIRHLIISTEPYLHNCLLGVWLWFGRLALKNVFMSCCSWDNWKGFEINKLMCMFLIYIYAHTHVYDILVHIKLCVWHTGPYKASI